MSVTDEEFSFNLAKAFDLYFLEDFKLIAKAIKDKLHSWKVSFSSLSVSRAICVVAATFKTY